MQIIAGKQERMTFLPCIAGNCVFARIEKNFGAKLDVLRTLESPLLLKHKTFTKVDCVHLATLGL